MKWIFFLAFSFCFLSKSRAATLIVEGKYQNKNVYVHNSFISNGVGFCAKEIRVNGMITTDETNSSAIEIDLRSLRLKYGDTVVIEIEHGDGCTPKVLNIEDLKPRPTFEVLMMNVTNDGSLKWRTKEESGPLPFVVEQFKWNKWIPVGVVGGIGTPDEHEYSFRVAMHSGENRYRIRQKGLNYITRTSREVAALSNVNKPSFAIPKDFSSIDFSDETFYEIYDAYGQVVRKGYGKRATISNLTNGDYYLCYDNVVTEFRKLPVKQK
jgi:hypothetical protein